MLSSNNHRKQITDLILEGEEHPSMQDIIDYTTNKNIDGYEFAEFFQEMMIMQGEGEILYDGKHDVWIWTGISNDKLRKLVDESVRL